MFGQRVCVRDAVSELISLQTHSCDRDLGHGLFLSFFRAGYGGRQLPPSGRGLSLSLSLSAMPSKGSCEAGARYASETS